MFVLYFLGLPYVSFLSFFFNFLVFHEICQEVVTGRSHYCIGSRQLSGLHVITLPPTRHAHVLVGAPFRKSHREIYRQPIDKDNENSAGERFPRQCAMLISSSKQDCVLQRCVLLELTKRQTSTQRRQYGMYSAQGCGMHSAQGCAMIFRRAKGGRQTEPLHVKTKGWYLRAADISLVDHEKTLQTAGKSQEFE